MWFSIRFSTLCRRATTVTVSYFPLRVVVLPREGAGLADGPDPFHMRRGRGGPTTSFGAEVKQHSYSMGPVKTPQNMVHKHTKKTAPTNTKENGHKVRTKRMPTSSCTHTADHLSLSPPPRSHTKPQNGTSRYLGSANRYDTSPPGRLRPD